jgi:hypothetical protein
MPGKYTLHQFNKKALLKPNVRPDRRSNFKLDHPVSQTRVGQLCAATLPVLQLAIW